MEQIKYKIEKDVPIPERPWSTSPDPHYWENSPFPFGDMEVGDSFLVPFTNKKGEDSKKFREKISYKWARWKKYADKKDWRFRSYALDGQGVRVWRIK